MSLRKFFLSRVFLIQLILAAVLIFILVFATMQGLKNYTRHGQSNPVPDFSGMSIQEASIKANQNHLIVEIIDSIHSNNAEPGAIVDQVPEAGFKVKENRTIFVTLNSNSKEQVTVPKLIDVSFRQAQVLIENGGLKVGQILYRPSEYNDLVLQIQMNGKNITPGTQVAKGSGIDLIIGRNQGNTTTPLPWITGFTVQEAQTTITNAMLNPGVLIYDESIITKEDSANARIWKQRPSPKTTATVNLGSTVDFWITVDTVKIGEAIEQNF